MASVNKVILVGNVGRDPEVRHMPSGEPVANLSLATTDKWKSKSGEQMEDTEWHRVSFFGKTAEVVGQYVKKGSQLYIEGKIKTRKYTDKDGVEKYSTEIRGDIMQMLGGRQDGGGDGGQRQAQQQRQQAAPAQRQAPARQGGGFADMDSDVPF